MTIKRNVERIERALRARNNGGEPAHLVTWATHKREICEHLGLDPDDVADDAQGAHAAGFSCLAGQVASALGVSEGEFLRALRAKARGGGLS